MMTSNPFSQATNATHTPQSLYDLVGGEKGIKNLVRVFYDIVETNPEAQQLHLLHIRGNGVAHSRLEQFNFLSGFLGGPKLYVEKHGHSNITSMHEHVEISNQSKNSWLYCMNMAIDQVGIKASSKEILMRSFSKLAEKLVNQAD
jgi:hemoglobin